MNSKVFEDLHLSDAILRAIRAEGYQQPTEIQSAAIPEILAGRDVIATAQTGTGKTAAFCLPMLDLLQSRKANGLRALVLTPTRELALQVEASLRTYGRNLSLKSSVVVGGASVNIQRSALQRQPDILVATPGRLLDLIRQNYVRLDRVEILVLDEADRMLDMGFIHDVRAIVDKTRAERQTLLFSATLSPAIAALASDMQRNPVTIATAPASTVAVKIDERVLFVDQRDKAPLLVDLLQDKAVRRVLVFTRTKHRAERLMRHLTGKGIPADAIHSNRTQKRRERSLADFDNGRIRVLVATDIVARGIDVESISHVINYELPNDTESYVHRVGRTARAGAAGTALSFCDASEILILKGIEKLIRHELTAVESHAFHSAAVASMHRQRPVSATAPSQWHSFRPRSSRRR
jgi:ATP-dependent RNA helicase RhlE